MLQIQNLIYIPKIIYTKLISQYHNKLLASPFGIIKPQKLVNQKYYWLTFCYNIKAYIKGYNVYLTSKAMKYKLYENL